MLQSPPPFVPAAHPPDEPQRLQALRDLNILDTAPETIFEDIAALAAQITGAPIALISLMDADRQWFKSHLGMEQTQMPRDLAFCGYAILGDSLLEVPDATQDSRFAGHPLVTGTGEARIRFYAGVPLRTQDAHNLGTLCVIDSTPRQLNTQQREALARLARQVVHAIDMRQAALRLGQTQKRLQRLADFNALRAQVHQALAAARDDNALLQSVCKLAVQHAHVRLAYVAQPDASDQFQFLASAGQTGYLDGLVLSVRPDRAEGQGLAGRAWREAQPLYDETFNATYGMTIWGERALHFGLQAIAVLPIRRSNAVWALLVVYHPEESVFDDDLRSLLDELALDLTRGLDQIDLAHREQAASAMRDLLLGNTLAAIASVRDRRLVAANTRFVEMLGYANVEDVLQRPTRQFYADDAEYQRITALYADLREGHPLTAQALRLRRNDGQIVLCDISVDLVAGAVDEAAVVTLIDVTGREHLRLELERSLAYQHSLMDSNAAGIYTVDLHHIIQDANPALCAMFGYTPDDLIGRSTAILHPDQHAFERFNRVTQRSAQLEHTFRRKDGSLLTCQVLSAPITLPHDEPGLLRSIIDVTALHAARQAITHQALHDALTDLPNRRALDDYLPKALSRAQHLGSVVAVGILDLDEFKPVNDTHGHEAGDKLLQELAARLGSRMRSTDLLTRFGGDEFVLVLDGLDELRYLEQIDTSLARLHQTVESAFEVTPGVWVKVGMSMGLALYPHSGATGDALLRQADAALYQIKSRKLDRARWWQLGAEDVPFSESNTPVDPFSAQAAALLGVADELLRRVSEQFVGQFLATFVLEPEMRAVVRHLDAAQMRDLAQRQANHLGQIFDSRASHDMMRVKALRMGQVQALVGVDPARMTRVTALWRQILSECLRTSSFMTRARHELSQVAEARSLLDLQAQIQAHEHTVSAYFAVLDGPLPQSGTSWQDALADLLQPLAQLPGMQACFLMRPDSKGRFQIESGKGRCAQPVIDHLHAPAYQVLEDEDTPAGQGLVSQAWRQGTIQTTPNYGTDERLRLWRDVMVSLGIQSTAAIPVANAQGQPIFVLVFLGCHLNQFETPWMSQFTRALQNRATQFWQTCRTPTLATILQHGVAQAYRKRLFAGGLRLDMQPVVDLHNGACSRVEALARLQLEDGHIVPPGVFLPLLGDNELDRLFQQVLDQALRQVTAWQAQGHDWDVAVNLPPSTLRNPQCVSWVRDALSQHGVAAQRLTLELLETESLDSDLYAHTINVLHHLGVKLAMDDLGSGYSSLKRLSEMPFDTIKIDQGLTLGLRKSPLTVISLIRTLLELGENLDRQIVVEGLEDAGMIEAVIQLGATHAQGFGLARPMPVEQILDWRRGFVLSVQTDAVHTFLGALACHWMHMNRKGLPLPSLDACPVTRFLAEWGLQNSQAALWHAQVHAGHDVQVSSQKFMNWLIEQAHNSGKRLATSVHAPDRSARSPSHQGAAA